MSILFRGAPPAERRGWPEIPVSQLLPRRTDNLSYRYQPVDGFRISAVVASVGLRAGLIAQMPIRSYRDIAGAPQLTSPQPELIARPSDIVVPSVWKTQMSISRDIWGFALGQVVAFDAALYPKRVEWIDPSIVSHHVVGGQIVWRIGGEVLDPLQLLHIPSRWVLPGNPVGISPLEHAGLVDLAKMAQEFGRDWFRYGSVPSAVIYADGQLTQEQADGIVDRVLTKWRNRKPAVLGSGLKYESVSVTADESQFLETVRQAAAEIAVCFNLPPEKVGSAISGQSLTYANRTDSQAQLLIDALNADMVVIEESLDRVTPRGQYCKFKPGALLRSDLPTRYAAHETGIRAGFLTINEARALEEMPPLPEVPNVQAD